MPDKNKYNLDFRPTSYFETCDPAKELINRIKGDVRRNIATQYLEENADVAVEGGIKMPDSLLNEALTDEERLVFGSIHPKFMGGEYLPPLEPVEVEIARVSLRSTTGDVNSVRAQSCGNSIRYRIVDEYYDEPVQKFICTPGETARPLTMGELIDLIDGVEDELNPDFGRGMTNSYRCFNEGASPEENVNFVSISSQFYPELAEYYREEAQDWFEEQKEEFTDDDEDTID